MSDNAIDAIDAAQLLYEDRVEQIQARMLLYAQALKRLLSPYNMHNIRLVTEDHRFYIAY